MKRSTPELDRLFEAQREAVRALWAVRDAPAAEFDAAALELEIATALLVQAFNRHYGWPLAEA